MATKNNIRSIRFSDELAELIDRQIGDTFTQKFENLVTKCVWELPNREKQLKDIEEQIKKERERLYRLERATEQLRQLENDLKTSVAPLLDAHMDRFIARIEGEKRE